MAEQTKDKDLPQAEPKTDPRTGLKPLPTKQHSEKEVDTSVPGYPREPVEPDPPTPSFPKGVDMPKASPSPMPGQPEGMRFEKETDAEYAERSRKFEEDKKTVAERERAEAERSRK